MAAVVSQDTTVSPMPVAGKTDAMIAAAMMASRKRSIGIRGAITPAS